MEPGVRKYQIKDICHLEKGKQIDTDLLDDSNQYKYINGGIEISGLYSEYNTTGQTIIVSEGGASCGYVNYMEEPFWCGCHCYRLTDIKMNPKYVFYALKANQDKIMKLRTGSAMPNIKKSSFECFQIRLSENITEQNYVVKVLEKICALIKLRKRQIENFDMLINARFIELVGDPENNPNNWPIVTIGAVIKSCESGWSGNGTQRPRKDGEIAVLKVSAVTKGYFLPTECKVLDDQVNIKKYISPEKGDLLFSRANTREMVGATAVITQDYPELILPDKLWKIRFINTVNVFYMKYILSYPTVRAKFSAVSTGTSGSMYNVSMDKFKMMEIPMPAWEVQEQFAAFVAQVDKSKAAVQKSLDEMQLLFNSLMQEYFG